MIGPPATLAAPLVRDAGADLIARIAAGDVAALRSLYRLCAGRAMALALRILKDRTEAEDTVQDTFVEIWRRAREYDARRGKASTWVATIARSRAIDRMRSRHSAARTASTTTATPVVSEVPQAIEAVEERQNRERVTSALASLPPEQRNAIELAYFEGLTQREISERTGDPLGTVKTRIRLGLIKLADALGVGGGQ